MKLVNLHVDVQLLGEVVDVETVLTHKWRT